MSVPDNLYFGKIEDGSGINYKMARSVVQDTRKIELLELRLEALFIDQVSPIIDTSPFPLVILTFIGIETLGQIVSNRDRIEQIKHGKSKEYSRVVYKLIDEKLLRPPTVKFKNAYIKLHNLSESSKPKSYVDVIHRFQRNTLAHGYQARGVYLENGIDQIIEYRESDGYMIIEPKKFWLKFLQIFRDTFSVLKTNPDSKLTTNALKYWDYLLGE